MHTTDYHPHTRRVEAILLHQTRVVGGIPDDWKRVHRYNSSVLDGSGVYEVWPTVTVIHIGLC